MLPSIKTLKSIAGERAGELRKVLEITKHEDALKAAISGKYPATDRWIKACYNVPRMHDIKLSIADEIIGTYGVEYIEAGSNSQSPAIWYCNSGDTYTTTLLYVAGRGYRVGCWGDIVERGNYA